MVSRDEALAVLVIHELNILANNPCCSDCCAPCGVLRELVETNALNEVIQAGPSRLYEGSDWWVDGAVDQEWLLSQWSCQSRPPCGTVLGMCEGCGGPVFEDTPHGTKGGDLWHVECLAEGEEVD